MYVRIIRSHRDIVTICDSDLLGKTFKEEKFQLDIKENFYKGEETSKEKAKEILQKMAKDDASFNIVGSESTKTALEAGIITQKEIRTIQGVPFALVLL